jgi:transposase
MKLFAYLVVIDFTKVFRRLFPTQLIMKKLQDVDTSELKAALEHAESGKAAKRLIVALAYKDGVDVMEIEQRYGIPQSTIYYWLQRFEERSLPDALEDEARPGRPPKLTPDQRAVVESWVEESTNSGECSERDWTASKLQDRILDEFGVEYSIPHLYRTFLS